MADLLQLQPAAKVLDLGCGFGRLSVPLAQRGFAVTGLDSSAFLLDEARARAAAAGVDVTWRQQDMRTLDDAGAYDAVVCWFTTFGYDADEELRATLHRCRRALRPGGQFLVETLNRSRLLEDFQEWTVVERGVGTMVDQNRFDPQTERTYHERTVHRQGETPRSTRFEVRHFTFTELRDWLLSAGFAHVTAYGGEGEAFDRDSTRMVVVAGVD